MAGPHHRGPAGFPHRARPDRHRAAGITQPDHKAHHEFLTRKGYLIEEQGMTYLADTDPDLALGPLRAGLAPTALPSGPGGLEVLSLQTDPYTRAVTYPGCCVSDHGFSLHAEVLRRP